MILPTTLDLAKLPHHFQVRYALYAATQVAHLATLPEAATCLRVVEAYLDGKASKEDCRVAATAAYSATAAYAAHAAAAAYAAAAGAAHAAAAAAYAAAAYDAYAAAAYADVAAYAAAYVAARVADYAAGATGATRRDTTALVADLRRYYEELLNFDAISESYLLGT